MGTTATTTTRSTSTTATTTDLKLKSESGLKQAEINRQMKTKNKKDE